MVTERLLDVSDLEPPEPLVLTLEAAGGLQAGEYLRMRHRRDPCLLFDNLRERGLAWLVRHGRDPAVEVFIWRGGDVEAERLAHAAWREAQG